jgi:hypothetical protein
MARFISVGPIAGLFSVGNGAGGSTVAQYQQWPPGTTGADTVGNANQGDLILGTGVLPPSWQALNAGGVTQLTASAGTQAANPQTYGLYNLNTWPFGPQ